jgi:hypothetical protein
LKLGKILVWTSSCTDMEIQTFARAEKSTHRDFESQHV